jgi:hypothetical protein
MELQFSSGALVGKVKLSIQLSHQFQSLDDVRVNKKLMHEQVFKMVMNNLERELNWQVGLCKSGLKRKSDGSLVIKTILEQCRAHMKSHLDINLKVQEHFDDTYFCWLFLKTMDLKDMSHGKFKLWLEDDEAGYADMSPLEWKRGWIKSQLKQLSLVTGEERASTALTLCRRLGLLRLEVKELNELGETPLLAAAAGGERSVSPKCSFLFYL